MVRNVTSTLPVTQFAAFSKHFHPGSPLEWQTCHTRTEGSPKSHIRLRTVTKSRQGSVDRAAAGIVQQRRSRMSRESSERRSTSGAGQRVGRWRLTRQRAERTRAVMTAAQEAVPGQVQGVAAAALDHAVFGQDRAGARVWQMGAVIGPQRFPVGPDGSWGKASQGGLLPVLLLARAVPRVRAGNFHIGREAAESLERRRKTKKLKNCEKYSNRSSIYELISPTGNSVLLFYYRK